MSVRFSISPFRFIKAVSVGSNSHFFCLRCKSGIIKGCGIDGFSVCRTSRIRRIASYRSVLAINVGFVVCAYPRCRTLGIVVIPRVVRRSVTVSENSDRGFGCCLTIITTSAVCSADYACFRTSCVFMGYRAFGIVSENSDCSFCRCLALVTTSTIRSADYACFGTSRIFMGYRAFGIMTESRSRCSATFGAGCGVFTSSVAVAVFAYVFRAANIAVMVFVVLYV